MVTGGEAVLVEGVVQVSRSSKNGLYIDLYPWAVVPSLRGFHIYAGNVNLVSPNCGCKGKLTLRPFAPHHPEWWHSR